MFSKFQYNLQVPKVHDLVHSRQTTTGFHLQKRGTGLEINPDQRKTLIGDLLGQETILIWVCLEKEDHDPGRFWLKLIASLRKYVPNDGIDLLAGLQDHHSQPLFTHVKHVFDIIHQNNYKVVLENISTIKNTSWWQSTLESMRKQNLIIDWMGIDYQFIDSEVTKTISADTISRIMIWDIFWNGWMDSIDPVVTHEEIRVLNQLGLISSSSSDYSIPIQGWSDHLQGEHGPSDDQNSQILLTQLAKWLLSKEEWLEGIRVLIALKEFEQAGDLIEKYGETWLSEGFDRLELLFWLRELPSVLLEARPQLCWLAAIACKDLQLKFLMNYYIHHAENTLTSFLRFSRNQPQWKQIEINQTGLKVGSLLDKLTKLKDS